MKCPHCGQEHPDNTKFCPHTGKKLDKQSITCSNPACDYRLPLPNSAKFCPNCGIKIGNDNHQEIFNTTFLYDEIFEFHHGFAVVKRDWKYGVINTTGKEVIPCIYDWINEYFEKGFCIVQKRSNSDDDIYGVIDIKNRELIPVLYYGIDYDDDIDAFVVTLHNECMCIMSKTGETLVPPVWDFISWYENGIALAKNGRCFKLINRHGEEVYTISREYSDAQILSDQLIAVKLYDRWGIIDRHGKIIVNFKYDDISPAMGYYGRANYIIIKTCELEGLMDYDCKVIIPCKYNRIFVKGSIALVYQKKYCNLVDIQSNNILGSSYKNSFLSSDDYFRLIDFEGKALLVNRDGEVVIPPTIFSSISEPINGLVRVTYHDSENAELYEEDDDYIESDYDFEGIIDLQGNMVIPWMYEEIRISDNGLIIAKFNGQWCIITQSNEMVFSNNIDTNEWNRIKSTWE